MQNAMQMSECKEYKDQPAVAGANAGRPLLEILVGWGGGGLPNLKGQLTPPLIFRSRYKQLLWTVPIKSFSIYNFVETV